MVPRSFALIGPGRVGTALAYLLCTAGIRLTTVIGRTAESLERARQLLPTQDDPPGTVFAVQPGRELLDSDFVILALRDAQIEDMVERLWQSGLIRRGQVVIHLSGSLTADTGRLPAGAGVGRLAMHPLQAVADPKSGIAHLPQAIWSLEGDSKGLSLGQELAELLSLRWIRISAGQKPIYHAAACLASNYLVTLVHTATEMLQAVGFSADLARDSLWPLVQGTVDNLKQSPPRDALTGPLARGDVGTIRKHLEALAGRPEWVRLYRSLGLATLPLAPGLSRDTLQELSELLAEEDGDR
ncbi:MAG: Rossmann-like and DUF2520 domain-containing protein [Bacillota bacterium]